MKKIKYLLVMCAMAAVTVGLGSCNKGSSNNDGDGGDTDVTKSEYDFTYDLNYEGSTSRTIKVKKDTRATKWKATRSGYTLDDWYTEASCENLYDFTSYVTKDTTVYAKWIKNAEKFSVTFDFNYVGAGSSSVISVEEGSTISSSLIPECPRLGYVYEGWYTESSCTTKWNFDTDTVSGNLTLYAKYEYEEGLPRDENGNLKYENITIGTFVATPGKSKNAIKTLINNFNTAYEGQIKVIYYDGSLTSSSQGDYSVRFQQIPGTNESYRNNYTVQDVFGLAGIELDESGFYAGATQENYLEETLYSLPIASSVSYLVYNKELMEKYNGTNALPSNFEEFKALMIKAYEGESATNAEFKSIITNTSWTFKENTSMLSFFQNDAPYYEYEDGSYVNHWDDSAVFENAVDAVQNIYDLFNPNGACHGSGGASGDEFYDETAYNAVSNKNALFGVINIADTGYDNASAITNNLGVMPISGLFASEDKEGKDLLTQGQYGFTFYKAGNISTIQLAAGAVFANYVMEHSMTLATYGYQPLSKAVVESTEYQSSTNNCVRILRNSVNPENLISLDGMISEKAIFNKIVAESYLVDLMTTEAEVSATDIATQIKDAIVGSL